ncbi:unnamed protein product [Cuscuta campestris]|uniref:Uncharacterized protein n=1 Tax=Cuscuta campestris TaxID=132261 RepID=A0A484MR31_9ASTE|nr:unnamed protein product [Cuscuta campestris]VFQ91331.1 unnamed protein product [Cuscuta campestris]
MSDREDSQNPSIHSYGSERPATSPPKKPVDAPTYAPSSSAAQEVSVAQPVDEGFILLDDRLLPSHMQKAQVHELRNLMPDGYQLTYRATWKNIISLHAGTMIGIHYHSIRDLGEFSIHPFKVLFLRNIRDHARAVGPKWSSGWKDKYVSIKFPPAAFPFAQNAWGKRMKRQVKPRETDDLAAWETTLWAGDASTRGPYNVGKWGVYPGQETDPEPEIVLTEGIPHAIPLRRVKGSKALVSTTAGPSRPGKKKKEKVVKFNSKFATPKIVIEEPSTAQPLSQPSVQPFSLDEQPAPSHQGTSQPIHSGELYINVDTLEFDNMMAETGHTSEAGLGGQQTAGGGEEEAIEEGLQRKRRRAQTADQSVGRIGHEWFTRLVKSRDEEKARMEGMMVECRKEAKTAHEKAEKKLVEHCAVYLQLYAKHEGLLKAAKEVDVQAQEKIQRLEAEKAALQKEASRSAEEIARLGDKLEKERAERASLAAAWAIQEPEQFASRAIADRDAAIRLVQGLYKHEPSPKVVDEIATFGFESSQYDKHRALYGILEQRIEGFEPKTSLPGLHDEAPVPPFPGI